MLGLIKTTETLALVCSSDPTVGGDTDEWIPAAGHAGATVVTIRPLNDRQLLRLSGAFEHLQGVDPQSMDTAKTLEFADAMERIVRAAFVRCAEGEAVTEDVDRVVESMRLGPLIGLGSFVLSESGSSVDPT